MIESLTKVVKPADRIQDAIAEPDIVDWVEWEISKLPSVEQPLTHWFLPGIYMRQAHTPAGAILTSKKHKTEHFFILAQGVITVVTDGEKSVLQAPYFGITKPGTRRIVYAHTETIFTTIHLNPDDEKDPDKIIERITEPHSNPFFTNKDDPRINIWKKDISPSFFATGETP
jgi:hypothetical protein